MNVTKQQSDALNAVITIKVEKADYAPKVEKTLKDYCKTASIPGFRKGFVPMSLVKKQYGKAVLIDQINKILQDALHNYITEEKLNILGNPLPKEQDINWDNDDFEFEFEIGLSPEFSVDLNPKKALKRYEIIADDAFIDQQIDRIVNQYGKLVSQNEITDENNIEVTGSFFNQTEEIDKSSTFSLEKLSKKARKTFVGKKVGDQFEINTKKLFEDAHSLMHYLGVPHDKAHDLDVDVVFTVEEINKREPAELNQELFDKLFPQSEVTSEKELRDKIRENAEAQYTQQADQQMFNTVTEYLVENTSFELPATFLKKWLRTAGEKPLTQEQADQEFEKSEKGLRYQLIESKIIADNNLNYTYEELKDFAKQYVKNQMLQYGMPSVEDEQLENIVSNIFKNRDEVERLSQQLISQKLLNFYKENIKFTTKKVTFDQFLKEVYQTEEK